MHLLWALDYLFTKILRRNKAEGSFILFTPLPIAMSTTIGKKKYTLKPFFNNLDDRDQHRVLEIFRKKSAVLDVDYNKPESAIESIALQIQAQKDAFHDVLTKKGFDIESFVEQHYRGRIAALTSNGRLMMYGRPRREGRITLMTRVCDPRFNRDHEWALLGHDAQIGESLGVHYTTGGLVHSPLRGLACNPRGADGDELEDITRISIDISNQTQIFRERYKLERARN